MVAYFIFIQHLTGILQANCEDLNQTPHYTGSWSAPFNIYLKTLEAILLWVGIIQDRQERFKS